MSQTPPTDLAELNKLKLPLADVRMVVVELMKDGFTEVPLGSFLLMLNSIVRGEDPTH